MKLCKMTFRITSLGLIILIFCLLLQLPLLLITICNYADPSIPWICKLSVETGSKWNITSQSFRGGPTKMSGDKFLGGLLSPDFEESSCLSRYGSSFYHKPSIYFLSPHLVEKLRSYEALHRRCGPHTELYNKSVEQLRSSKNSYGRDLECNYLVWLPIGGFGNRALTIVSAFLYALLNDKVLLLHVREDFAGLLCEPFPGSSWVLPSDFPVRNLEDFDFASQRSYGSLLRNRAINKDKSSTDELLLPPYIYLHLESDYNEWDKLFYCEDEHEMLQKLPWLLLRSDNYFVPALFLIQSYEEELNRLFPQKEAVFYHLGRYLLHPTNQVWRHILRYYHAHLSKADERLGIQIRLFSCAPTPFETMLAKILNCSLTENLLPAINRRPAVKASPFDHLHPDSLKVKAKAVLVTSLDPGYSEKLRRMYYYSPTATGEVVDIYQPSQEGEQLLNNRSHNLQAWSEIYLLSFSDVLMTTAWSTFGYLAQGLGGLKPWILLNVTSEGVQKCRRAASPEPCFHSPPTIACKAHEEVTIGKVVSHVRPCEDRDDGIKLFD